MKNLIFVFALCWAFCASAQPSWNEQTRATFVQNMGITQLHVPSAQQNRHLDSMTARAFRVLGIDKEGNRLAYIPNIYYDRAEAEKRGRLSAKFEDFVVVVEIHKGIAPETIKHPKDTTRVLTSMKNVVPYNVIPSYEFYAPSNAQIRSIIKNKDKDPDTYNWVRNGGLLLRKVTVKTKKLVTVYANN